MFIQSLSFSDKQNDSFYTLTKTIYNQPVSPSLLKCCFSHLSFSSLFFCSSFSFARSCAFCWRKDMRMCSTSYVIQQQQTARFTYKHNKWITIVVHIFFVGGMSLNLELHHYARQLFCSQKQTMFSKHFSDTERWGHHWLKWQLKEISDACA